MPATTTNLRPRALAAPLAALATLAALALPAAAPAAPTAEVSLMDDQLLLGARKARVESVMSTIRELGVDRLRVSAFWSAHAPAGRRKPRGFDGADHLDRRYDWTSLDRVWNAANVNGIKVMISITTPAPLWATGSPGRRNPVWRPKPAEFADFAAAVARRYGPGTDQYGLLNEPNQGSWLQPQAEGRELVSPHIYRRLVLAAYPRIKAADSESLVLVGELAPSGRDQPGPERPVRPLRFLRAMACRNDRMGPMRRGPCRGFRAVPADAIGHHPYSFFTRPDERSKNRDDATLADTRRLLSTLDRLTARRAIRPSQGGRLDVYYTEFGYQTDPPDPFAGIPLGRQDRFLQEAAYIVWKTPRVQALNQFRLTDGRVSRAGGYKGFNEFQSGLYFRDFRPKPSAKSFPTPLFLVGNRLWGQIRPGHQPHTVTIEFRSGGGSYREVGTARTNDAGYFITPVPAGRGEFRVRYGSGSPEETSQPLTVGSG